MNVPRFAGNLQVMTLVIHQGTTGLLVSAISVFEVPSIPQIIAYSISQFVLLEENVRNRRCKKNFDKILVKNLGAF